MDQVYLTINSRMSQGLLLGGLGCFLWGMVSVLFSPCHLASIPLIVGYVGGQNHLLEGRKATLYAVVFTAGLFITYGDFQWRTITIIHPTILIEPLPSARCST